MKIAFDITPIINGGLEGHQARGAGFYIQNLQKAFLTYFPKHDYMFFSAKDTVPGDADIIHYPYFDPFFLTLPWVSPKKTIVTIHDLIPLLFPKRFPSGIKGSIKWNIQKILLKHAAAVITDSYSSKKDISEITNIPESKIHVVYLSAGEEFKIIEKKEKLEKVRLIYKIPGKFVLYVGDVTWNKNLPALIQAVQKLKLPLVMVGKALTETNFDTSNPWNNDRQHILELTKNDPHIIKLGFIPTEDLVSIYNVATAFCMPSFYEGFGLPILEAMSCGCPVVTSKEGSLPEVAGEAAYYVDARSIESITNGIQKVFSDQKLQQELKHKSKKQAEKFSWKKTAQETIQVYTNSLSE